MRMLIRFFALFAALCTGASAQVGQIPNWPSKTFVSGGSSYTGPGDINGSAMAWYGLRAFSSATRGNKIANVCNSTGGVDVGCADLSSDATTGALVPATVSGITCPGANCTVKTLYDQSGALACTNGSPGFACDVTQATVASRPTLVASGLGSLPVISCSGTQRLVGSSTLTANQAQPYTFSGVAIRTSSFTTAGYYFTTSGQAAAGFAAAANTFDFFSNGSSNQTGVADSAWHAIQVTANGAASNYYIDGSSTTHNPSAIGTGIGPVDVCDDGFGDKLHGSLTEVGVWPADKSANNSTINSNQHAYWGF